MSAVAPLERERALALLAEHDVVPLAAELPLGDATPVSLMRALGVDGRCFLLESASGGGGIGGHSFLGHDPVAVAPVVAGDPLDPLEPVAAETLGAVPELDGLFSGGWVGFLGYEAAARYERVPLAADAEPSLSVADFALYRSLVIVDHAKQRILVVSQLRAEAGDAYGAARGRLDALAERVRAATLRAAAAPREEGVATELGAGDRAVLESSASFAREAFTDAVRRCLDHIRAGDIFQVQLSRRFALPLRGHPFDLYAVLRELNPSPYLFYLSTPSCTLVGASPETLVRVRHGVITYRPIAGTRRRGRDPGEDAAMEHELRTSEKENAEHLMLVDLGRNDVGRVARTGSVQVTEAMVVERYSHVMHLVSGISGELEPGRGPLDALRAAFPAGTVTGAPKIRAMEIIAAEEPHRRGPYAGAVGYIGSGGLLDTAIALRTVVVAGGTAYVQAAAGIVADSDPDEEAREVDNKVAASVAAVTALNARG